MITVVSYNLRKHAAAGELTELVGRYDVDVLCLQEVDTTDMPERIGGLVLADATRSNRLGLAIYYRENGFRAGASKTFSLKKSLHDIVLKPADERMLGLNLHDIDSGTDFIVSSFHAAPLTALNSLRRHQIRAALKELSTLGKGAPILMVGDFNYPVFKENLSQVIRESGYELSLSDARTYTRYKFFKGYYDFATSSGFEIEQVRTLPQGASDHLPILVTAKPIQPKKPNAA
ncbi:MULTISPECIES: endonuclease/exonuclease/phosphatase family protein [Microbacterium]|uniref:Endonuclease/exonuclease/phosphatase family protein n=1 Tax=Microbacterium aquilitoris TaxID=3067307 RepID=A0ABU3GMP7_9MICO|nr:MULTISPECIES: endonuclease/exonuclease/phosphatase family protein [unclassified Microbacterium]MDT3331774.1 endonuclease/exonuclease/phosphatase family protein [Microbacterium sp. KSW-18]MDT3346263.1 endonuclease/exonuclease/phosphatase family protein [Microbacterium sp. KSW2-22]SDG70920.1 Metal-dependent hydrolase, endonuclease/exonuclease/phosphatase family [Microbacterium sp. 77mftsu3.1]